MMKLSSDSEHGKGDKMRKSILLAAWCVIAVSVHSQVSNTANGTIDNSTHFDPSRVTLPELTLRGSVPVTFATLLRTAGISGGVATSYSGCSEGPDIPVSISAGTKLDNALSQVAANGHKAEWQLRDGVANLLPSGSPPPLLLLRVSRFEWDSTKPPAESIGQLVQAADVSRGASELRLRQTAFEGGASAVCARGDCTKKTKSQGLLHAEEDATVLTLLNHIVKSHPGAVWNYSEYRCADVTEFSLTVLAE